YGQFGAFDGHTGKALRFDDVVRECDDANVIMFGEHHSDVICNAIEAQLLCYLLMFQAEPTALAMEFFETDTQSSLDAYLASRIAEAAFIKQSRQNRDYLLAHRPLIEMCRGGRVPVIAANAPRRLVRQYRTSKVPFDEFRRSLPPEDQRWLPR